MNRLHTHLSVYTVTHPNQFYGLGLPLQLLTISTVYHEFSLNSARHDTASSVQVGEFIRSLTVLVFGSTV